VADIGYHYRYLLLILLLLLTTVVSAQTVNVEVDESGVCLVSIKVEIGDGLQSVRLPIEPIVASIVVLADGKALPVIYENNTLYLILDKPSTVDISYIANVSLVGNVFHLSINTDDNLTLKIPTSSVILLTLPKNIISFKEEGGVLTLVVRGPQEITYSLRVPSITQTVISTPTNTATTQPTVTQPTVVTPKPDYTSLLITGIVVVAVASGVTYVILRRRRVGDISKLLDDVDRSIIRELKVRGGSALQSELQDSINVPKTTLWRHVKRLERLGVVRVEKVGLQNRVTLVRDVKV
jgi:uncharacterized membrane protein